MPHSNPTFGYFNNATDNLFLLEVMPGGRFRTLEANEPFSHMVGIPREALIGRYVEEVVPAANAPLVNATYRRCVETGAVIEETIELDLPKGRSAFHAVLMPLRDDNGTINRILGITSDLGVGTAMEHCLPVASLALNTIKESIYLIDQDARILLVNDEACRSLGFSRDELQGMTISAIAPDLPAGRWQAHWLELRRQRSLRYETQHTHKQGRTFPVEVVSNYFEIGGHGHTLALARDISARKQSESELRLSEQKYRTIFEESFDCLLITSPEGRILDINKRGIALFGYAGKQEIQGLDLRHDLYADPTDRDRILALVNARGSAEFEAEFKKKSGETITGHCVLTAMKDEQGLVSAYRGIIHDITEKKRAEVARGVHLRFLEAMNAVNEAMQGTSDFRRMTAEVLDLLLPLFFCDRASLLFPCAPESASWRVPVERTRPGYVGAVTPGDDFPLTEGEARVMAAVLAAEGALAFPPGAGLPLPPPLTGGDDKRTRIALAITPATGQPWLLCLHREAAAPAWNADDARLLREIGNRIGAALTSMQAYRALSRSEERFRLLSTNSPATIASLDQELVYTWGCNTHRLFGSVEIIGKRDRELLPPYEAQRMTESEQRALKSGESQQLELSSLASGRPRWFEIFMQPAREHGGKVSGVSYYAHEITERKVTESLLRQREREFRSLANNLPAKLARYDRNCRLVYVNKALVDFYVMAPEELLGKTPLEALPGRNLSGFQQALREVVTTGIGQEMELVMAHQDAVHLVRISPECDETGRVVGTLVIGQDITESKHNQTRLEQQAAKLAEANNALKVLLQHGRLAETEIQEKCLANIEAMVLPYLSQLGELVGKQAEAQHCLECIKNNLRGLATSNMGKLASPLVGLSQREIRVADLIRTDHSSKTIAAILGITPGTVEFYRDRIRAKLGIKKKKVNLKNYLRSHFSG